MRGLDGCARLCRDMLDVNIDSRLAILEDQLGEVPPNGANVRPQLIHWTEVDWAAVAWDAWPWVAFVPQNTAEALPQGREADGTQAFDYVYNFRAYFYVRGEGYDEVAAMRGRLGLAVRECLLAHPKLANGVRVLPNGVLETFSDIADVEEWKQNVAAGYISFQVRSREALSPAVPPLGHVETTTTSGGVLP